MALVMADPELREELRLLRAELGSAGLEGEVPVVSGRAAG